MIINTGMRTDIVQYYTSWLLKRFEEGYVFSRNPVYNYIVTRYELNPNLVDCVIFCSKNYRPILKDLHKITDRFNTHFQYTITAYDKDIEPNVPSIDESIKTLLELEKIVNSRRICWRYDPVLLTNKYTIDVHKKTFEYISSQLAGHIDRCIFSFVAFYNRFENYLPELVQMTEQEKDLLAKELGTIARKYNIHIQTCGTNGDYLKYGVYPSSCVNLEILGKANGVCFKKIKHSGLRIGCHCIESRDIGAYTSCPNACKYCYANSQDLSKVMENYKKHDPNSPLLIGNLTEQDTLQHGKQISFLVKSIKPQREFFFSSGFC